MLCHSLWKPGPSLPAQGEDSGWCRTAGSSTGYWMKHSYVNRLVETPDLWETETSDLRKHPGAPSVACHSPTPFEELWKMGFNSHLIAKDR